MATGQLDPAERTRVQLRPGIGWIADTLHALAHLRREESGKRGLFVGSGVVEASCKSVIGQRLKQAGMHWTVRGADAIIALRCREASATWEAICNTPHTQTRTA